MPEALSQNLVGICRAAAIGRRPKPNEPERLPPVGLGLGWQSRGEFSDDGIEAHPATICFMLQACEHLVRQMKRHRHHPNVVPPPESGPATNSPAASIAAESQIPQRESLDPRACAVELTSDTVETNALARSRAVPYPDRMSDAARQDDQMPHGTSLLARDLTTDELSDAPVLESLDALLIEGLTDDEDDAFAAAINT